MSLTFTLPDRESTLAFHRQRWEDILADRSLSHYPGRIETNAFGQTIMSPPPALMHSRRQSRIAILLEQHLGKYAVTECGVITNDGVKIVDVGWYSHRRIEQMGDVKVAELAPEICVEILSPSNTAAEMEFKRVLYFNVGAIECWQCDLQGRMTYYEKNNPNEPQSVSTLCPEFPAEISD